MARLARARVKNDDYLPNWAKCCDWPKRSPDLGEFIVDLDKTRTPICLVCHICNTEWGQPIGVLNINTGKWIALDFLDLDEGPSDMVKEKE